MFSPEIEVRVLPDPVRSAYMVVIFQYREGKMFAFTPFQLTENGAEWGWVEVEEEGSVPPAAFILPRRLEMKGVAQKLVDEFGKEGILPSVVKEEKGKLGATEAHLEDLRRILFSFNFVNLQRGVPLEEEEGEENANS